MIYLLDDNKGDIRQSKFKIDYVDNGAFEGYLTAISHLPANANLSFMAEADCLLVHETTDDCDENGNFISKSNTNVNTLKEDIANNGKSIPLVAFSNQMTGEISYDYENEPNYVKAIAKTLLYQERLYPFLNHYKKTGQIELRIIVYGENFYAVEAGRYAKQIIDDVAAYDRNKLFDLSFLTELTLFERFYAFMKNDTPYNEFINDLEDNPITVGKFVQNLQSVVESLTIYGKNIHDWEQ
ncbi:hypothetical protein [Spirosoma flavum]|uniref:DUF3822 family protein n=1 Tax=Spirosoma flavum TaxID=2048557 RepID=A0ABW6AL18_9BACT